MENYYDLNADQYDPINKGRLFPAVHKKKYETACPNCGCSNRVMSSFIKSYFNSSVYSDDLIDVCCPECGRREVYKDDMEEDDSLLYLTYAGDESKKKEE